MFGPIVTLIFVGIVCFVLSTMPDSLMGDPDSPFIGELRGLIVACVTIVVVSAVGNLRCIVPTADPVRTTLVLNSLFLVLTVAFTLGFASITEVRLTWVGPIGSIVGVGVIVGVVRGLMSHHAARHR